MLPYKGFLFDAMSGLHNQGPNAMGRRGDCADFEINHVECLEAYGMIEGQQRCVKYAEDLYECRTNFLKYWRVRMMNIERYKKIAKGELPISAAKCEEPPYDAFLMGGFNP